MLKGITWGQFSVFLLWVAVVYYLYVLLAYYRTEALGWIRRKGSGDKRTQPVATGDRIDGAAGEPEPEATGSQAELFEEEVQGQGDAGFQQMQHAIGVIRQMIRQGIA